MKLRFIHFSDSHLGFVDYTSDDFSVQKAREDDAYKTVAAVIDHAIETKPDFVIHTGDFFHRPSPYNKAIIEAGKQFKRLSDAGIPFYMIAGNHDLPKSEDTRAIHEIYEMFPGCKIFYDQKYSTLDCGSFILHALPHINFSQNHLDEINKIAVTDTKKPNILLMHLSMPVSIYKEEEPGGGIFPVDKLAILKEFNYVALGHWHRFNHLNKYGNVCYSGSTERINSGEADHNKGFVEVTIDDNETTINFKKLETREYLNITVDGCSSKTKQNILDEISAITGGRDISEAIVRVVLKNVKDTRYYEIMRDDIHEITGDCLVLRFNKILEGQTSVEDRDNQGGESLVDRLLADLRAGFPDEEEFKKFEEITKELFEEIITQDGGNDN
ncbi:MAG: exonuclease SbcCD subunit D [Ignavibacteriales bacterium]|jgi:exonuclease SbcD|nr:exonuclease SbcCD subunit D [Ignavibacteriales bacterium]MBP7542789.1 exonuclease SbcCD subunit D [Ignavibacteriaceae bacterium]MBP9122920.1 exonuclease SbcCD subunit D [Ignavibacteriaceae bacterium]